MRKSLWIVALFLGAVGAPNAYADTYTDATFTCDTSCVDVPTDPVVTFPGATIPVSFFGETFHITLDPSDQDTDTYTWGVGSNGSSWYFVINDTTDGISDTGPSYTIGDSGTPYGSGGVCFTSVPEPSSGSLLLLGVGITLLALRFMGRSHLQAT